MKVLILAHPSHISPDLIDEKKIDFNKVEWEAEYDVKNSLKRLGHEVMSLGVYEDLRKIRAAISEFRPNIVFNLLEEFCGEAIFDQNVVSFLELLDIPYTGCHPKGLILGRDKALSKKILSYHRIPTPRFQVYAKNQRPKKLKLKSFPLIVKCLDHEASTGLSQASVVTSEEKLIERVNYIHSQFKSDAIVESFVEGSECFVGVYGNYSPKALPVWELCFNNVDDPNKEFYSNRAKFNDEYRKKKGISTSASRFDDELKRKIQKIAVKTYKALGLCGYARIDFRVDLEGNAYVIEANPNPDISKKDDFASSAIFSSFEYDEVIKKILNLGLKWSPRQFS